MANHTPPRKTVTLDNGPTLFLQEKHDAPVISLWTWYRVGSRNELPGLTGVSHWVEHMQFKGTPTIPKGSIFGAVSRVGGYLNAMTSTDWTAYFETLPADQVDLAIGIESDRMTMLFDADEVASERTVILSERQGAENRPTYRLYEEVIGAAFPGHAYSHSVIGREQDLKRITRDDLYNHYRRYYRPDNAFITVVGAFDADEMTKKLTDAFGGIQNPDDVIPQVPQGAPQLAERRITLRQPSPASYLMMGYKVPGAKHEDVPALMVADAILSGAKAMGMGGGGGMGRSSRLYKALVASGLARSASSSASPDLDESLWSFNATALPGVEPERIEEAIEAEIERLKTTLPEEEEFIKARKQIRAQYVYSQETVTNQAFWLGNMEILDHAGRVDTFADEFDAVTPADVQRVAQTYLVPHKRTIGWQIPDDSVTTAGAEMPEEMVAAEPFAPKVFNYTGAEVSSHGFVRTELPNGIVVLAQPRPGDGAIDGTIRIRAGHTATGDTTPGLANLTGAMLNRGTENRTFEAFNDETDGLGAMVGTSTGKSSIDVGWHSLAEDLDHVLDIAADIIRNPLFPEAELEKVRQQVLTGIREADQDTGTMAALAFQELLYPEGHPNRIRTSGTEGSVKAIQREQLAAYHKRHFGPTATTIALVGGVQSLEVAVEKITRAFGDWTNEIPEPGEAAAVEPLSSTQRATKVIRGKSQADIAIGFPTIPRLHEDYYALQVANLILGQLGLMGRLGGEVRDKNGLAYYAMSSLAGGVENSLWSSRAGVDPANVDRALAGIDQELRRIRTEPVTDDEFADAKSYLIGSLPLGLESLGGVTDLLLTLERYGLGLDYLDRYPDIIGALMKDDLLRAMATHIDPDRVAIGIAGPEEIEQGA